MAWQEQLHGDSVTWLLESDQPNLRYLALRYLLDRPTDDPDLITAQIAAHKRGPIATILDAMQPVQTRTRLWPQIPLVCMVDLPPGAAGRHGRPGRTN